MVRLSILAVVLAGVLSYTPVQQDRGFGAKPAAEPREWTPKRRVVVTIGIDRYQNWPRLTNAVSDADEVTDVLHAAGFVEVIHSLRDNEADRNSILRLVEKQLPDLLEDDDDLVLFFAGHGVSKEKKVGSDVFTAGYIVPVEASAPDKEEWGDYLPLGELLESVGTLPPRHVLLILDSCRSGVALGRVVEMSRGSGNSPSARVSRMVITSADANQDASDSGPVAGHSLFTGILIQGLTNGDADLDKDGVITDSELAQYLKSQVKKARGSRQTPEAGQFLADNRGEMSFPKPDPKLLAVHLPGPVTPNPGPPLTRGPKRAVRQAIVIACDQYRRVPNLAYAVADARGVGKAFEDLGYEVSYAINPTRSSLEEFLVKAARQSVSDLGSLTVFYAGHGYSDQRGNSYFALTDFDANDIQVTGLSYRELQDILAASPAQQRLFFIDAQVSQARRLARLPAMLAFAQTADVGPRPLWQPERQGYRALVAGAGGAPPIESAELAHGVFSYYLIRGLQGAAAGPDGVITFEALAQYVTDAVAARTRSYPISIGPSTGAFPIGVVRPAR